MKIDKNDIEIINGEKYIKTMIISKYLNVSNSSCGRRIAKDTVNITLVRIRHNNTPTHFITIDDLLHLKSLQENFWNNHIDFKSACNKYGWNSLENKQRVKIPYYAKVSNSIFAFIKAEFEPALKLLDNYISRQEAKEILCLIDGPFKRTVIDYGIEFKITANGFVYLKDDVEFFKAQQKDLGTRYISYEVAAKTYGEAISSHVKSHTIPHFAKRCDVFGHKLRVYYDRKEIEEYIAKRDFRDEFQSTECETDYETFKNKLSLIDNFNNLDGMPYTRDKLFNYVAIRLQTSSAGKKSMITLINRFISISVVLEEYLIANGSVEIYSLNSAQLNLLLNSIEGNTKAYYLYRFIRYVAQEVQLKLKVVNGSNKGFSFDKINNPLSKKTLKKDNEIQNEIYSFSQYKELFKYLTDIEYHKSVIYDNTLSMHNKSIYLSTWLYLVLHLNNAWRNGDISSFPRLCFDDLMTHYGISDFDWFEVNEIPLHLSNQVISRIIKYDFGVNKTKVEGHFFCSDSLAPTLSTILLMLEIYTKYVYIGDKKEFNRPIMLFYNKYNEPYNKGIHTFIRQANISDFTFQSKKMNKSILTYIYELSDDKDALLLPKYMRSHIKSDTTLHYLKLNNEDMEFLTEQLFERGEFGYIYDTLVDLVNGEYKNSKAKTENIKNIKNTFGDELKIEATVGLINYFTDERKEILELLNSKGYEECVSILNDIYMSKLPSREDNIQCLYSQQECKCLEIDDCVNCKYSIPSIYALNTLCSSLRNDLVLYENTTSIPKKLKLSVQLYRKKSLLKEALDRYGKEYIYSVLDMTREDFIYRFSEILKPKELILLKEKN